MRSASAGGRGDKQRSKLINIEFVEIDLSHSTYTRYISTRNTVGCAYWQPLTMPVEQKPNASIGLVSASGGMKSRAPLKV